MTIWEPVLALALGGLGALLYLAATWSRAAVAARGWTALAMISLPISIAAPALCLSFSVLLFPLFGWVSLLSFWLIRSVTVASVVRL